MALVREPKRGALDGKVLGHMPGGTTHDVARFADVMRFLRRRPSFWFVSFGAAISSMQTYGLSFWLPAFMMRSPHFDLRSEARRVGKVCVRTFSSRWSR